MAPVPPEGDRSWNDRSSGTDKESDSAALPRRPYYSSSSSNINEENPFIQFRRFADAQISSVLRAFPGLFSHPSWTTIWMDDTEVWVDGKKVCSTPKSAACEGWRKRREQEAEEKARAQEANRNAEMSKWGWNEASASAAAQSSAGLTKSHPEETDGRRRCGGTWNRLGWDGKQRCRNKSWKGRDSETSGAASVVPAVESSASPGSLRDPFSGDANEAIEWLLTDEYSPVFLRGHLPSGVDPNSAAFHHALHHPHWPDFWTARFPDRFEKELRFSVPWCDAFEDLLSLQNNGHMIDRDETTRSSSWAWLLDMAHRGSLSPKLGSERYQAPWKEPQHNQTSNPSGKEESFHPPEKQSGTSKERIPWPKEVPRRVPDQDLELLRVTLPDREEVRKANEQLEFIRSVLQEMGDEMTSELESGLAESFVRNLETIGLTATTTIYSMLKKWFGADSEAARNWAEKLDIMEDPSPEAVAAALQSATASQEPDAQVQKTVSKPEPPTQPVEEAKQDISSSSTSTSSVSRSEYNGKPDNSIVASMTTTTSRTLPDGSIEIRRVLKKRFADGREESKQTFECRKSPDKNSIEKLSQPRKRLLELPRAPEARPKLESKQTQTEENQTKSEKKGGWFWN